MTRSVIHYELPDGTVAPIDATVARGAPTITFQQKDGTIIDIPRIDGQWYRLAKRNGALTTVDTDVVRDVAASHYLGMNTAFNAGRFGTPYAVYIRGDQLIPSDIW